MQRIGILAAVLAAFAAPAQAGSHPHDRNGFMIGFGVGGGSAGIEDGDEREGSATGNFRIGYAVRPDLVLHFEGSGWTKKVDEGGFLDEVTWTFSTGTAAITWFPGNAGAFLRAGLGAGTASVEVDFGGGLRGTYDETGLGVLGAVGYEWRLTRMFALGPHAEFTWMDLDDIGSANVIGGALDFNWYW